MKDDFVFVLDLLHELEKITKEKPTLRNRLAVLGIDLVTDSILDECDSGRYKTYAVLKKKMLLKKWNAIKELG